MSTFIILILGINLLVHLTKGAAAPTANEAHWSLILALANLFAGTALFFTNP